MLLAGVLTPLGGPRRLGAAVVVTTFTVLADIAANVAGDRLTVESITKSGAEIHGYEPTPGDVRKAAGAVLVIRNGLGLDRWFDQFTDGLPAPSIDASDGVVPIPIASDAYAGKPIRTRG